MIVNWSKIKDVVSVIKSALENELITLKKCLPIT